MTVGASLETYLAAYSDGDPLRTAVSKAILGMADAGMDLSRLVAEGPHGSGHAEVVGSNTGGDAQKALDIRAHEIVLERMRGTGIAALGSEETDLPDHLQEDGLVVVATDPLDGSSNIDTNVSIGTIFSVLPATGDGNPFFQPGSSQLAAGYIVYGPHTDLVLTVGKGTVVFTLDRQAGDWTLSADQRHIDPETNEFAINASNYRHWGDGVRAYFDDCIAGADGAREKDFNMRWVASLVAEATRILARGGIFLYPGDSRRGYDAGRLRLIYEANPIALLVEQAGGRASDGAERILDLVPEDFHQRTPLIFGAANEVARVEMYKAYPDSAERAPLFGYRGLFRV